MAPSGRPPSPISTKDSRAAARYLASPASSVMIGLGTWEALPAVPSRKGNLSDSISPGSNEPGWHASPNVPAEGGSLPCCSSAVVQYNSRGAAPRRWVSGLFCSCHGLLLSGKLGRSACATQRCRWEANRRTAYSGNVTLPPPLHDVHEPHFLPPNLTFQNKPLPMETNLPRPKVSPPAKSGANVPPTPLRALVRQMPARTR